MQALTDLEDRIDSFCNAQKCKARVHSCSTGLARNWKSDRRTDQASAASSWTPPAGVAIVAIVKSRSVMTGVTPAGSLMCEM